jgi:hypothetical protein
MGCCWRGCARTASWTRSGSRAPGPTERSGAASADGRGRASRTSTGRIAKARRPQGKSDPLDAEAAARAAQAGRATVIPKDRAGAVEALRALRVARAQRRGRPRPSADPDEVVDRHRAGPAAQPAARAAGATSASKANCSSSAIPSAHPQSAGSSTSGGYLRHYCERPIRPGDGSCARRPRPSSTSTARSP